jgi:membrane protein YdbS with pleckstrin-like domain
VLLEMEVAMIPIDPRVRKQWRIEALAGSGFTLAVTVVALLVAPLGWLWGAILFIGLGGLLIGLPQTLISIRYRHWRYGMADDTLILEYGVWTRRQSTTPYFRVQNVDVSQGPLERWLGLKRLTIKTASAFTDATIPGLDAAEADQLRLTILERAGRDAAV